MSQGEGYRWIGRIGERVKGPGYWQVVGPAMYSWGVVMARACAPSRVAATLGMVGRAGSVQRRLERWLANVRLSWAKCCGVWSALVRRQYVGEPGMLVVNETKPGKPLSGLVVGLAYRGCCLPLAVGCYRPQAWPVRQVELIEEVLSWVAEGVPAGCQPLIQADRGIGTSPDLLRVIQALGWY